MILQVWAATLGVGYTGCVRDLVVGGRGVQLADLARTQDRGSFVGVGWAGLVVGWAGLPV